MKTAIVTDIHGNLPAFEAVIRHAREQGAGRFVCLGDTVGYGAFVNECCEQVRALADRTLLGNHDAATVDRMSLDWYHAAARAAVEWTQSRLSAENAAWLRSLDYAAREGDVQYSHGAPVEPEEFDYFYDLNHAVSYLPLFGELAPVNFLGHNHLPRAFALHPDEALELDASIVELQPHLKYVFPVGSVGQPRDQDPRAAYCLFDDAARTVRFERVHYDIERAACAILEAGLPPAFAARLYKGV